MNGIVYGGDLDASQKTFEAWCKRPREGEEPPELEFKRIVRAEFVDQLLSEAGSQPLDWQQIEARSIVLTRAGVDPEHEEPAALDDLGEGYWVDVNELVPPQSASLELEALRSGLPEDIRAGLNWSVDKKFLFLVSSLCARPIAIGDIEAPEQIEPRGIDEPAGTPQPLLEEFVASLPRGSIRGMPLGLAINGSLGGAGNSGLTVLPLKIKFSCRTV
jgi:hypothetical protein